MDKDIIIQRDIQSQLTALMREYPVVSVLGPRQSGKTTLVRHCYPHKPYVNLEELDTRETILADPRAFFKQYPAGAILDEIQRAATLMSYIQSRVDEHEEPGQFILTGSHQMQLHQSITQTLAGRTALLELLPFTIHELQQYGLQYELDNYLLNGFYPAIYRKKQNPTSAYRNYIKTYVERDVRQLINVKDLNSFQRFVKLCAGRVASILNIESLANDVGVSANTIKSWLSILQASYVTYTLQPYFENFGKRAIKSPKLYFDDVGLVCYLLGVESVQQLQYDRQRGALFENLVIMELIKYRLNQGKDPHLYYYRDNHQNEVDAIVQHRHFIIPIEIKSAITFNVAMLKNIKFFSTLVGERAPLGFVVYAGEQEMTINNIHVINYRHIAKIFQMIDIL